MATDVELAVKTLLAKQQPYSTAWNYYDGPQPLVYTNDRLAKVFRNITARFANNWISVAVDALLNKLELARFEVLDENGELDEKMSKRLQDLWTRLGLNGDEEDVETAMLVCGESYVIGWKETGADGEGEEIQAFYHDPRACHIFHHADNPKEKRFAAKWWQEPDGRYRLTLYYPDRLEYYVTTKAVKHASELTAKAFIPYMDNVEDPEAGANIVENPVGRIPVIHYLLHGRKIKSYISTLVEPQDTINKLLNDMMVTSEFGAFPQRFVITHAGELQLKNAPNLIWEIPAADGEGQDVQVGQLASAQPDVYLQPMESQKEYLAIEAALPRHYFDQQGGTPSGEALIAMEAPLNQRARRIIEKRLIPPYRELAAFLLYLDGVEDIDMFRIKPVFTRPETIQPLTQTIMVQNLTSSGAGLRGAAKAAGYDDVDVEVMAEVDTFGPSEEEDPR